MTAVFDNRPRAHTKTIFWEYGRQSNFFNYPNPVYDRSPHLAVREGKWKLLVNADGSQVELYNLEADPYETADAAANNPELTKRLKAAALAWKKSLPMLGH
jgi:arylsulfatase A-like enzyme